MWGRRDRGALVPPPSDFGELIARLDGIVGKSVAELAAEAGEELPASPLHGKGFQGELIELLLGASAQNRPEPDFPGLALELKTIPVDAAMRPLESTFICHADLNPRTHVAFEDSVLWHKMRRMLLVPLHAERGMGFGERTVRGYAFYEPEPRVREQLREDFEELMGMVARGEAGLITARLGTIIQMRPKAASGRELTVARDADGQLAPTRPRGFYARRSFTAELLARLFPG
ncbi:MAG: DNA mismatch repair protein MutH [Succinivibrionaceae bacterium]|nr:DNA mismatch repair protein MutH [Succinivibrionaceae bacterium]